MALNLFMSSASFFLCIALHCFWLGAMSPLRLHALSRDSPPVLIDGRVESSSHFFFHSELTLPSLFFFFRGVMDTTEDARRYVRAVEVHLRDLSRIIRPFLRTGFSEKGVWLGFRVPEFV